jgi:hypothetical protein
LFAILAIAVLIYFFVMLPKHPEWFQPSEAWLKYQDILVGSKATGLQSPVVEGEVEIVQPIPITQGRKR